MFYLDVKHLPCEALTQLISSETDVLLGRKALAQLMSPSRWYAELYTDIDHNMVLCLFMLMT